MKFYIMVRYHYKIVMISSISKISYNYVTSISLRNWAISRCKLAKTVVVTLLGFHWVFSIWMSLPLTLLWKSQQKSIAIIFRSVFRTQSNISDVDFLQKYLPD